MWYLVQFESCDFFDVIIVRLSYGTWKFYRSFLFVGGIYIFKRIVFCTFMIIVRLVLVGVELGIEVVEYAIEDCFFLLF